MADLNDKLNELNDTADSTSEFDAADIEANKSICILSYLGWLLLIPLLTRKDSAYVKFHCNQGLLLAIVETAVGIVAAILSGIPVLGAIIGLACGLCNLCVFILAIIGIVNTANGKAKDLPLIGFIKLIK